MRIRITRLIINFTFAILVLSLFFMQLIKGSQYRKLSESNCVRLIAQEGRRGRILDRQGTVIVDNYISYDAVVLSESLKDKEAALRRISSIANVPYEELIKRFKRNYRATFLPVVLLKDVDRSTAIKIEEQKGEFPGISIQENPKRYYPYGSLAAHVIGYLGQIDEWRLNQLKDYGYKTQDVVGYSGVEEQYDYYLRSDQGGLQVEVDHQGRFHKVLGLKPSQDGKDIQLTIDIRLQKIIEDNLAGQNGAIVVMEPYTGEILAMASFPTFSPDVFISKSESKENILTGADAPLLNRCISSAHPPGSVFKTVTATSGLESKKINTQTTFICTGGLQVGRRRFACWDTHGQQNIFQAITHSCDVFFYHTGILAGPERLYDYAIKFGLGSPTRIDLPSEIGGFIPSPLWKRLRRHSGWYDGDTANFSIGQGDLLITPIQITRLMAVFANEGNLVSPHIVKSIDGKDISRSKQRSVSVPIKKETIEIIRSGLRGVINDPTGTSYNLFMPNIVIAGKTGTAQAPPGQPHAWFAGFFPYQHPSYVICVFLEHGGSSHVATEMTKRIIEEMSKQEIL